MIGFWTNDGSVMPCNSGQVDFWLNVHLSVGQVKLFPYFYHCRFIDFI